MCLIETRAFPGRVEGNVKSRLREAVSTLLGFGKLSDMMMGSTMMAAPNWQSLAEP